MEKDMTKGSPLPVILRFTLPLIIGNIFQVSAEAQPWSGHRDVVGSTFSLRLNQQRKFHEVFSIPCSKRFQFLQAL